MNPYIGKITGKSIQEQGHDEKEPLLPPGEPLEAGEPQNDAEPEAPVEAAPAEEAPAAETGAGMEDWQRELLQQMRERFISERVSGFTAQNGETYGPVAQEEAEERWAKVEPRFIATLNRPYIRAKFAPGVGGGRVGPGPEAGDESCPHCGQPMPNDISPEGEMPPENEMPPEGPGGEPEENPEEPQPRLPESARSAKIVGNKLDED